MMSATVVMTFIITFFALIQPCPAPCLIIPAIGAAVDAGIAAADAAAAAAFTDATLADAAAGGSALAAGTGRKRSWDVQKDETLGPAEEHKRSLFAFNSRAASDLLNPCIGDFTLGNSSTKVLVGNNTIQVDGIQQNWAIVNGIPDSCKYISHSTNDFHHANTS
jgi:hypothetical protein